MKFIREVLSSGDELTKAIDYQVQSGIPVNPKQFLRIFLKHDLRPLTDAEPIVICNGSGADRADYDELYANLRKNFVRHTFLELKNKGLRFSLPRVGPVLSWKIWRMLRDVPLYQRLARFAYTVYIFNSLAGLDPAAVSRVHRFVGFLPYVGLEGALARIFSGADARIFMIQHALFDRDENYKPIDKLIYEPSASVELLCWGTYSARKLEEFPYKKIHLAGNLRTVAAGGTSLQRGAAEKIYVIMPAPIYRDSSQKLIQMMGALSGKQVVYRLHPSDTNAYVGIEPDQVDRSRTPLRSIVESGKFDVFISCNSTAYYDIYLFGGRCLNFITADSRSFVDIGQDQFQDLDSLRARLAEHARSSAENAGESLTDLFGTGLNNYRDIVEPTAC